MEFFCYENNVPVDISMEQNQRRQLQEYQDKLTINSFKIPDPLSLKSGWVEKKDSIILSMI